MICSFQGLMILFYSFMFLIIYNLFKEKLYLFLLCFRNFSYHEKLAKFSAYFGGKRDNESAWILDPNPHE